MHHLLLTGVLFFLSVSSSVGQTRYPKRNSLNLFAGLSRKAFMGGVGFTRRMDSVKSVSLQIFFENIPNKGVYDRGDLNTQYLDLSLIYRLLKINQFVTFGVHSGLSAAREKIEYTLIQRSNYQKNVFGMMAGPAFEFYIRKRFGITLKADQRYFFNSSIGKFRWQAGLNFMFLF